MSKDVGMAVPKTTETRCGSDGSVQASVRDGSVQARHVIQRLYTHVTTMQVTISTYFFASNCYSQPNSIAGKIISGIKNDAGMGLLA